jgi:hypothetical protein
LIHPGHPTQNKVWTNPELLTTYLGASHGVASVFQPFHTLYSFEKLTGQIFIKKERKELHLSIGFRGWSVLLNIFFQRPVVTVELKS